MASSISRVEAISGTVQAIRKASLSCPAPKRCAMVWSRTSPNTAPAAVSPAVTAAALARNRPSGAGPVLPPGGPAPRGAAAWSSFPDPGPSGSSRRAARAATRTLRSAPAPPGYPGGREVPVPDGGWDPPEPCGAAGDAGAGAPGTRAGPAPAGGPEAGRQGVVSVTGRPHPERRALRPRGRCALPRQQPCPDRVPRRGPCVPPAGRGRREPPPLRRATAGPTRPPGR